MNIGVFLIVVAGGVLAIALAHIVGGWLLANGLRDGALRIQKPGTPEGLAVRELTDDVITLEAGEPRQEIGHPGIIGLAWPTGYGQMGELIDVDGWRVTRAFNLLEGTPPTICTDEDPKDCPPVVPDSFAFPNDPSDVGLEYEEVRYPSPLGAMGAWVVPSDGPHWAIHVHGLSAHRREATRMLRCLHESGYTSMAIDYRNDPDTPEDPSGHYRFGLSEWEDVEAAVQYALEHGAEDVILVGYSTGAAHILAFLERSDLAEQVRGLVFDSPNVILAETVRYGSEDLKIPGLGINVSRLLTEFGMWIADLRWDIDWDKTNYVQIADVSIGVPTLVFHGTSDKRVPISISRQLAARLPELVRLEEIPAAGHVMSWNADPARYESLLESFLTGLQN